MVELQHPQAPQAFTDFIKKNPRMTTDDFSKHGEFTEIKTKVIKPSLCDLQYGLCVYCEKKVALQFGEVEHIKPKSRYPNLCFIYTNYAYACTTSGTCGNKKGNAELKIHPELGCNNKWTIDSKGNVLPVTGLSANDNKMVLETIELLGLNNVKLVRSRLHALNAYEEVRKQNTPSDIQANNDLVSQCQTYLRDHFQSFQYIIPQYFTHPSA